MDNKKIIGAVVIAAVICLSAFLGYFQGQKAGYSKAVAEVQGVKEEAAKKAGEEAAKAANPFQATNPLEGVTANPFLDAVKKLNPFAK